MPVLFCAAIWNSASGQPLDLRVPRVSTSREVAVWIANEDRYWSTMIDVRNRLGTSRECRYPPPLRSRGSSSPERLDTISKPLKRAPSGPRRASSSIVGHLENELVLQGRPGDSNKV